MNIINRTADKYDYLVVGAGLYGCVMARELTDHGFSVLVLEKRGHIAGNCHTENADGIIVHKYGPHIFHTDNEEVWRYVNRFAHFSAFTNSPVTVSGNNRYTMPLNMDTFAQMWGITDPDEALRFIRAQAEEALAGKTPENFEEQAISMTGTDIYEKIIKGYSEKQWGRYCSKLPASIIKRIKISFDHNSDYYNEKYCGIPQEGYTEMMTCMLQGIAVITGVDYDDPEIRRQAQGLADKVIYTGSVDRYHSYCLGRLDYRSIRFEEIRIGGTEFYQDRAVVNFADPDIPYTRITEHRHFDPGKSCKKNGFTIISKEFPEEHTTCNEPMYPIRDEKNLRLYRRYMELSTGETEVHFGGRLGSYRYLDMDDVIAMALEDSSKMIKKYELQKR